MSRINYIGWKLAVVILLILVLISTPMTTSSAILTSNSSLNATNVTTTAPAVAGATTHPIEYHIGCTPSMVNDGSLDYFKSKGFCTVHLIVPDQGTYQAELNKIKLLGMQPIIDIETPIWSAGRYASTPISNYANYFQSLKSAGWEYVASEGGRQGDADYLAQYFKGYVNYNCDQCGLWKDLYKESGTVMNSWESYYTSEWPYIQQGAKEAATLGKQNGILAGVWGGSGNPIRQNSVTGGSPSYKSMLDWSYANGCGFTHFHVWFSLRTDAVAAYKQWGFDQIVSQLQKTYPATSATAQVKPVTTLTAIPAVTSTIIPSPTIMPTTAPSLNATRAVLTGNSTVMPVGQTQMTIEAAALTKIPTASPSGQTQMTIKAKTTSP